MEQVLRGCRTDSERLERIKGLPVCIDYAPSFGGWYSEKRSPVFNEYLYASYAVPNGNYDKVKAKSELSEEQKLQLVKRYGHDLSDEVKSVIDSGISFLSSGHPDYVASYASDKTKKFWEKRKNLRVIDGRYKAHGIGGSTFEYPYEARGFRGNISKEELREILDRGLI